MSVENSENEQAPKGLSKNQKRGIFVAAFATVALTAAIVAGKGNEKDNDVTAEKTEPSTTPEITPEDSGNKDVAIIDLESREDIIKPVRPAFNMPPASALPADYRDLPQMSYKPSAEEILAYAEPFVPEIEPLELTITFERIESQNIRISAQATKDTGYFFANGKAGLPESDAMANSFYEASLQNSDGKNLQAAHDLGYHLLHGKGAQPDHERARDLLTRAHEGGHPLSGAMLSYMDEHKLALK